MITTGQIPRQPIQSDNTPAISARGKLSYRVMVIGGVVLAATGIGSFVLGKAPMSQWVLMAHVSAAPLFAIGLAAVALTWADRCRFGAAASRLPGPAKALLWLILLCGLVVVLSGVTPMMPIFGTGGQHALYLIHRYSAIVLAGAVVVHLLSLLRGRK